MLGVTPKDLQNLVQFGVIKPRIRRRVFWFDKEGLLRAKVAFYLKESLGASTQMLARFTDALFRSASKPQPGLARRKRTSVTLLSRPSAEEDPVEIRVPLAAIARSIEVRLPLADRAPDLPRGRKRTAWTDEILSKVRAASASLKDLSHEDIVEVVRAERRRENMAPEVSVAGYGKKKATPRRR